MLAAAGFIAGAVAVAQAGPATATKKDDSFQTAVPAAILLDPDSDSVLYDKNADQLVAPASLTKLMTLEYVFNEIKQGHLKLDDEIVISENAWRKGGAPSHGSTMYAAIHSRVKVDDLDPRHHRRFRQRRLHRARGGASPATNRRSPP